MTMFVGGMIFMLLLEATLVTLFLWFAGWFD